MHATVCTFSNQGLRASLFKSEVHVLQIARGWCTHLFDTEQRCIRCSCTIIFKSEACSTFHFKSDALIVCCCWSIIPFFFQKSEKCCTLFVKSETYAPFEDAPAPFHHRHNTATTAPAPLPPPPPRHPAHHHHTARTRVHKIRSSPSTAALPYQVVRSSAAGAVHRSLLKQASESECALAAKEKWQS